MAMDPLGQRIASAVEKTFNQLNVKAGKPISRSNGVKEWSVLAGIVAVENDDITVLTISTGVKAMPNQIRNYSQGWIVHDMHAEILCLRLFNRLLVEEIENLKKGPSHLLEEANGALKYKLRDGIRLALYISEPPCGDASMGLLSDDKQAWEPETKRRKVVRGRAHFDLQGVVRTKPGRADSRPTFSKSCSDKLCVKQYTGILNCITSMLVEPVFLLYLVLREDKLVLDDFERCFHQRVGKLQVHSLIPLTYSDTEYLFYKDESKTPLPMSLLYTAPTKSVQVIVNGVKNGGHVKNKPPKPSGASFLCKRNLYHQARSLLPEFSMYSQVKQANEPRETLKKEVREALGSWPSSAADDFSVGR